MQVSLSPFSGHAGFPALRAVPGAGPIDPVSVADLLRNAFVSPPHSIYRGVGLATLGFDRGDAPLLERALQHPFARRNPRRGDGDVAALVRRWHGLLREAVATSTGGMRAPWVLQSGGKDSTSLAIALAEARPDAVCLTYLGGREEDEVASARWVAQSLGLRHVALHCDPARAYRRYLALVPRMPLLTADFALLSYADLATEVAQAGGDGLVDGLGSDCYFGMPVSRAQRMQLALARRLRWPRALVGLPLLGDSFLLCYLLGTLQMGEERHFAGSRFSDAEVDGLLGRPLAEASRRRFDAYRSALAQAADPGEVREMLTIVAEAAAGFAKGIYTAQALALPIAYPYCDPALSDFVCHEVPADQRIGADGANKALVRAHIASRFPRLPYVDRKGSFRFDLVGFARTCFEQVLAFAEDAPLVPGAEAWLKRNHRRLGNKFHASRFYLLAVTLPWLAAHASDAVAVSGHEAGQASVLSG